VASSNESYYATFIYNPDGNSEPYGKPVAIRAACTVEKTSILFGKSDSPCKGYEQAGGGVMIKARQRAGEFEVTHGALREKPREPKEWEQALERVKGKTAPGKRARIHTEDF
jgi:hypothetical protein